MSVPGRERLECQLSYWLLACQEQGWWWPVEEADNLTTSHLAKGSGREPSCDVADSSQGPGDGTGSFSPDPAILPSWLMECQRSLPGGELAEQWWPLLGGHETGYQC